MWFWFCLGLRTSLGLCQSGLLGILKTWQVSVIVQIVQTQPIRYIYFKQVKLSVSLIDASFVFLQIDVLLYKSCKCSFLLIKTLFWMCPCLGLGLSLTGYILGEER